MTTTALRLTAASRKVLRSASAEGVVEATGRLSGYLSQRRWLGTNNRYRLGVVDRLAKDINGSTINPKHLSEYLAASVPLHTLDGWSYLGRALQAALIGDSSAARHLAYYAELRAAMALLATQGIGVLNYRHMVLTSGLAVDLFSRKPGKNGSGATSLGTHQFAWLALEEWSRTRDSSEVIGHAVRPDGKPLGKWLRQSSQVGTWEPLAKSWLMEFGLDLGRLGRDRDSRNEASYRPSGIATGTPTNVSNGTQFVMSLWSSLEPVRNDFQTIGRHLLRLSLESTYRSAKGVRPADDPVAYAAWTEQFLDDNAVAGFARPLLSGFLTRTSDPHDLQIMSSASGRSPSSDPNHHLEMISRATLLLVISTGAARRTLEDAGVRSTQSAFWWGLLGADRGLWSAAPDPSSLGDLWSDIDASLEDLQDWLDRGDLTSESLLRSCSLPVVRLSTMELVGIWGIAA